MRPAEEEEEEFTMATKPIESIKSATALRAVGRLNESHYLLAYHSEAFAVKSYMQSV